MDHIQVVQQAIERHNEYTIPLCLDFIDYEKAFVPTSKQVIMDALLSQGLDQAYVNLLGSIYDKATPTIYLDDLEVGINIERDVRQGDA